MSTHPYKFQKEDVFKIHDDFKGRCLLANEMGTGKSAIALWYARKYTTGLIIVVCPKSIKENWRREALKHVGMRATVLGGMDPGRSGQSGFVQGTADLLGRLVIINYDVLGNAKKKKERLTWAEVLNKCKPELVVLDECHAVKSPNAVRTKAAHTLCKGVPKVICMSGTPLTNRPVELYSPLRLVRPDLFPSFRDFAHRYCDPQLKPWGWEFKGATNLPELHDLLTKKCMIRRRKVDVLKDLPAKRNVVVPIQLNEKDTAEYKEAESNLISWLLKYYSARKVTAAMRAERMVKMGYLWRLASRLKWPQVLEWVHLFLEESGQKVLLFGHHVKPLLWAHEEFSRRSVLVYGKTPEAARQMAFDRFNSDPKCDVFIGNTQAAGVGWSCRSAVDVVNGEMEWVPGLHSQAAERVYGINRGLAGMPVTNYWMVAADTIDEKMCQVIQQKQKNLDLVLDGKATGELTIHDEVAKALLEKGRVSLSPDHVRVKVVKR